MSNFTKKLDYDDLGKGWYRLRKPIILYFTLHEVLGDCDLLDEIVEMSGLDVHEVIYIKAPVGFKTDFASIPKPLRWAISPKGKYSKAAGIHDLLYQYFGDCFHVNPKCTDIAAKLNTLDSKEFADKLFLFGMKVSGVNFVTRRAFYRAVYLFGNSSYQAKRTGINEFVSHLDHIEVVEKTHMFAEQFPIFTSSPIGGKVRDRHTDSGVNKVLVSGVQHGAYITPANFGRALLTLNGNKLMVE